MTLEREIVNHIPATTLYYMISVIALRFEYLQVLLSTAGLRIHPDVKHKKKSGRSKVQKDSETLEAQKKDLKLEGDREKES